MVFLLMGILLAMGSMPIHSAWGHELVNESQKLLSSDGDGDDHFGWSVSVIWDVALLGAPENLSAYIFRRNGSGWIEEQKLLASDGDVGDRFGESVSVSGDVALVGADGDDDKGNGSGSAYIFRWNGSGWVEEQKLLASDGDEYDYFGWSVSVCRGVALAGAPDGGSAYIFRWNGSSWVEEQKLIASDGNNYDFFGFSVSISEDVALVGAPDGGSAYIFRWNGSGWVEKQKLLASDGDAGDAFGGSVSLSGDVALVGAYVDDDQGSGSGSAYIFEAGLYGDLNDDGIVDRADINIIRSHINQPASACPECDINGDGTINILDESKLTQFCTNDGCR